MQANELLLARARKGDAGAFEELVAPCERGVYFTCLNLVKDAAAAQDCAQEALLRAYRSIKNFRGESKLSTWLYRIAYTVCMDEVRRRKPAESLEEIAQQGFTPEGGENPEEALVKRERLRAVRRAINALPEDQRQVLVLAYLQGQSYEQIARITGAAEGTVKSRLNRAREKLRKFLSPDGELFEGTVVQLNERRANQ